MGEISIDPKFNIHETYKKVRILNPYRNQSKSLFPTDGLVSYYKLDETSGNQVIDSWGVNNGINYGATIGAIGKVGTAYQFASSKYCEATFDFTPTSFTISFWIYPTSLTDYNQQVSAKSVWNAFNFHTTSFGDVYCGTNIPSRFSPSELPSGTLELNMWQNFTYTFEGGVNSTGTGNFYKNGVLMASKTQRKPLNFTGIKLGAPSANTIMGRLDEFSIHNRSLSGAEVLIIYNNGKGSSHLKHR